MNTLLIRNPTSAFNPSQSRRSGSGLDSQALKKRLIRVPPAEATADIEQRQQQIRRNQAALQILRARFNTADAEEQQQGLAQLMSALDEERLSDRKLFV